MLIKIAKNKNTSPFVLHLLSYWKDDLLAYYIVLHKNTSPKTLKRVYKHNNYSGYSGKIINLVIVNNPNCSIDLLNEIVFSDSPRDFYYHVIGNCNAPLSILEYYACTPTTVDRLYMQYHPNCSQKLKELILAIDFLRQEGL
jgi:hypothetical protein